MNSYTFSIALILFAHTLFIEAAIDLPKTVNGKPVNKDLYNFMQQLSEVSVPLRLALGWNVENELGVLPEFAYELEWYETAMKEIADGAQKILNSTLADIKYTRKVDIRQFVNAIQVFLKTNTVPNMQMAQVALQISAYRLREYIAKQKQMSEISS